MDFHIIYPEDRMVPEKRIRVWWKDAVANGDIVDKSPPTVTAMAHDLSDAGLITLARLPIRTMENKSRGNHHAPRKAR